MKLSPLKATIKELTDKMAEFRKFIDEANKNYEETSTHISNIKEVFSTITTESKASNNTIIQLEGKITGLYRNPWHSSTSKTKGYNTNKLVIKIGDTMGVVGNSSALLSTCTVKRINIPANRKTKEASLSGNT